MAQQKITVGKKGKSDFNTIQEAIDFVRNNSKTKVIFIKNGIYTEKIYIDSTISNILIEGESRKKVIIKTSQARETWRCANPDDYGAATINVKGRDLYFKNLTVLNTFAADKPNGENIYCKKTNENQTVQPNSHQFAFRSFPGATRLTWDNCTFISGGGDTVSPWDVEGGLYYLKNCSIEGHVDAWCPRGYALAENCKFYGHNKNAFAWHDGSADKEAKSVLKNCSFDGVKNFALGRYHKDSQQYFVSCTFSENMADLPIYLVKTNNALKYGHRIYFIDCKKKGKPYDWYKNNTDLKAKDIDFQWVFGERWKEN